MLIANVYGSTGIATRGYYVPSVGSFFTVARYPEETGLSLDGISANDDQLLLHKVFKATYVAAPTSGVDGMFRGTFEANILVDLGSDFIPDGPPNAVVYYESYGKGVTPSLSPQTLNIETSTGGNVVKSRISLLNVPMSVNAVSISGGAITGNSLLVDNSNPAKLLGDVVTLKNLITGFRDGENMGLSSSSGKNGTTLTAKAENTGVGGNIFISGVDYTFSFTGPEHSAADDIVVSHTDNNLTALDFASNIRLDGRSLNTGLNGTRLINTNVSHDLTWTHIATTGAAGSGAGKYRVQISKEISADTDVGVASADQLIVTKSSTAICFSGTCTVTIPKGTFEANASFSIQVLAFDAADSTNRSLSRARYVSAASITGGCSNNSNNEGQITNGSPCAEYFQVQNPRIADNAGTDAPTFLDYAVNKPAGPAKAIVVLLTGGNGNAGIIGNAGTTETKQVSLNSLTRSAQMFADQGYLAVSIDRPTDHKLSSTDASYLYDDYRISAEHAQDIALVLNEVNKEVLNVFLVGTSRGAISALNQFKLGAGISMSVPVNSNASGYTVVAGSHPVGQTSDGEVAPADVFVPVHYLTNQDETCTVTQPATVGDQTVFNQFTGAAGNQFDTLATAINGIAPIGTNTCKSLQYHGFIGSELEAVLSTTNWLDGIVTSLSSNHPPRTLPIRRLAVPGTPTFYPIAELLAAGLDPDGDIVEIELATKTINPTEFTVAGASTRGGDLFGDETGLTYTPPVGATDITDAVVFVLTDQNGGRTSMVMTIDVYADANGNGIPDNSVYDTATDTDTDGLTLLQEYQAGTDPALADTDGDGMSDKYELDSLLDPNSALGNGGANADPDQDGFTNLEESVAGSIAIDNSSNPGHFDFTASTVSVAEGVGIASITVTRSGSVGAVSVYCSSSDIPSQAVAGTDYTAVGITLEWIDGDAAPKTCNVPITNDTDVETDETFQLDLSNPTGGAKLGTTL